MHSHPSEIGNDIPVPAWNLTRAKHIEETANCSWQVIDGIVVIAVQFTQQLVNLVRCVKVTLMQ